MLEVDLAAAAFALGGQRTHHGRPDLYGSQARPSELLPHGERTASNGERATHRRRPDKKQLQAPVRLEPQVAPALADGGNDDCERCDDLEGEESEDGCERRREEEGVSAARGGEVRGRGGRAV